MCFISNTYITFQIKYDVNLSDIKQFCLISDNKKPALSGPSIILCLFLNHLKMLQIAVALHDHHLYPLHYYPDPRTQSCHEHFL